MAGPELTEMAGEPGATDSWDPAQYNRFAAEREQPFWDLVDLIARVESPSVVDLGCGDGRLTAELHDRLKASTSRGVDRSKSNLEAAAAYESPNVSFEFGDIASWCNEAAVDVVFANASLQWVPNHRDVLSLWIASLRPGGQVAVQVPANADHPSHTLAGEVASELLDNPPPDPVAENVLTPEDYARVLDDRGCTDQHVRLQVYAHHLPSTAAVVEWVKGTTLTRFKQPLGQQRWEEFVELYRERLLRVLGDQEPYFYPFKRILMWGRIG